jgi:hypothetical protein
VSSRGWADVIFKLQFLIWSILFLDFALCLFVFVIPVEGAITKFSVSHIGAILQSFGVRYVHLCSHLPLCEFQDFGKLFEPLFVLLVRLAGSRTVFTE